MRTNIEVERVRARMRKGDVAKAIGVSPQTYTGYTENRIIPSDKLERLADLFGVSCDYLLGRAERDEVKRNAVYR